MFLVVVEFGSPFVLCVCVFTEVSDTSVKPHAHMHNLTHTIPVDIHIHPPQGTSNNTHHWTHMLLDVLSGMHVPSEALL